MGKNKRKRLLLCFVCKFVGCGGPKLFGGGGGGASGQGVLRETFGPGPPVEGKEEKKET